MDDIKSGQDEGKLMKDSKPECENQIEIEDIFFIEGLPPEVK